MFLRWCDSGGCFCGFLALLRLPERETEQFEEEQDQPYAGEAVEPQDEAVVAEEDEDVVLNNLGVPGETSTSFINVGQLAAALAQI